MKKIILLLFMITVSIKNYGQSPNIQWQKSFGGSISDAAYSIQKTFDSGYIVAGGAASNDGDVTGNHGGLDYWIIKLDNNGNIQWKKSYGGMYDDVAQTIIQTSDSGYLVGGSSKSNDGDVIYPGQANYQHYWLIKLDNAGLIQWQQTTALNAKAILSIQQSYDGGYIVAGYREIGGDQDYDIAKLNINGIVSWQKFYGGSSNDMANSIQQTLDGGYIITGGASSNDGDVDLNHGLWDYWIIKSDSIGNIQWKKSYGGSSVDLAYSVLQNINGEYIISGRSESNDGDVVGNHGNTDLWIIKLDANGDLTQEKSLGGSNIDGFNKSEIKQTSDGGYIIAGAEASTDGDVSFNYGSIDYWIIKLDNNLNIQWQKSFGGSSTDFAYSILETNDGGFIIAGLSQSNDGLVLQNHGYYDYWIIKLGPYSSTNEYTSIEYNMNILSNPCTACYVLGKMNFKDLMVTDIFGRKINASFEESYNGFYINLPSIYTGLFLIKNVLTGEVIKFIKE